MALNWIFASFFIVSFVFAIFQFLGGNYQIFSEMMTATFTSAKDGIQLCLYYGGYITLFQGLMNIGEQGGLVEKLSKKMSPFFTKIFPEIPANHPAMGSIMLNFSANALNLGNAATPFGLKAMEQMQELNPQKDTASNSQIMFLVLNTSGLTLIPLAILALRFQYNSVQATDIFIPVLLTTFCSSLAGLIVTSIYQKINLINFTVLTYLGIVALFLSTFMFLPLWLSTQQFDTVLGALGGFLLMLVFVFFIINGLVKKINVYQSFIDGAKSGVQTAFKIAPYLIGILVAIALIKTTGVLLEVTNAIKYVVAYMGFATEFIDAIPVALIRPLSGSGAEAMVINTFTTHGVDSFAGKLASIFQGSSETTFYVLAVYFGSVGISKTRYALTCGLLADLAGACSAIFFAYWFFG
jgi:spore maturation protein SpmA